VVSETAATAPAHADSHAHGHGLLHHHFDDLGQQRECNSLGMWAFLATELMMFGGLFFAYSFYRWMYPVAFHVGSEHLNIQLGTLNTFVLLFSSLSMAMAVHAAAERKRKPLVNWLLVTWLLGFSFLAIKAVEWGIDYQEGLIPAVKWHYFSEPQHAEALNALLAQHITPDHVKMYFTIYFCMAGLHAIHMIVGLILVGIVAWLGHKGKFTNGNDQPVELSGLYWHFIDIVWVFLFPLLYLIAGFHPFKAGG
jgi:cytochrome c oxidase subunit 3